MAVFADASTAPEVITAATTGLNGQLLTIAGAALVLGVTLFAIRKGWRLVKGFSS